MTARNRWPEGSALAVRGVLAGAYRGALKRCIISEDRVMLSHAVRVDAEGWAFEDKTVCRRVLTERLVGGGELPGVEELQAPTCPECRKRSERT